MLSFGRDQTKQRDASEGASERVPRLPIPASAAPSLPQRRRAWGGPRQRRRRPGRGSRRGSLEAGAVASVRISLGYSRREEDGTGCAERGRGPWRGLKRSGGEPSSPELLTLVTRHTEELGVRSNGAIGEPGVETSYIWTPSPSLHEGLSVPHPRHLCPEHLSAGAKCFSQRERGRGARPSWLKEVLKS